MDLRCSTKTGSTPASTTGRRAGALKVTCRRAPQAYTTPSCSMGGRATFFFFFLPGSTGTWGRSIAHRGGTAPAANISADMASEYARHMRHLAAFARERSRGESSRRTR